MTDPKALAALIDNLGLKVAKENWAFGLYEGVPLAVHAVATQESNGLLFHVRYPETKFAAENPPLPPDSDLRALVEEGSAEVSLDNKTGWLNLFSLGTDFTSAKLRKLLDEFIEVLKAQGVDLRRRLCLKCAAQPVDAPGFEEDRLQLLCEACGVEAKDRYRRETQLDLGNVPLLLIPGALCAVVGAFAWAGIWYSYHWVFEMLGRTLPVVLIALLYCCSGFVVGKLVSFFISRVRNRGVHLAGWIAVFFCALAVGLGEMLYIAALCLKFIGFIPPPALIADLWVSLFREFSVLYLIGKIISAATAFYIAYSGALPKRAAA